MDDMASREIRYVVYFLLSLRVFNSQQSLPCPKY